MRYRIYALGASGEIVSGTDLVASNDSEALHEAADHANWRGIEIWQGNRQVALVSPPWTQITRSAFVAGGTRQAPDSAALALSARCRLARSGINDPADYSS
jgi:hypothetical protein